MFSARKLSFDLVMFSLATAKVLNEKYGNKAICLH